MWKTKALDSVILPGASKRWLYVVEVYAEMRRVAFDLRNTSNLESLPKIT